MDFNFFLEGKSICSDTYLSQLWLQFPDTCSFAFSSVPSTLLGTCYKTRMHSFGRKDAKKEGGMVRQPNRSTHHCRG